jgi:hypothetical protein
MVDRGTGRDVLGSNVAPKQPGSRPCNPLVSSPGSLRVRASPSPRSRGYRLVDRGQGFRLRLGPRNVPTVIGQDAKLPATADAELGTRNTHGIERRTANARCRNRTWGATRTPWAANACASMKGGLSAHDPRDPVFATGASRCDLRSPVADDDAREVPCFLKNRARGGEPRKFQKGAGPLEGVTRVPG